jgi:hypothetical protein
MIIGLSVALGLFGIELIGFIGGISMFLPFQSLLCILFNKQNIFSHYKHICWQEGLGGLGFVNQEGLLKSKFC